MAEQVLLPAHTLMTGMVIEAAQAVIDYYRHYLNGTLPAGCDSEDDLISAIENSAIVALMVCPIISGMIISKEKAGAGVSDLDFTIARLTEVQVMLAEGDVGDCPLIATVDAVLRNLKAR